MNIVCIKTCQIRLGKQIYLVAKGEVIKVEEMPKNGCFKVLDDEAYTVDFTTASEEELLTAKWTFKEAQAAILEAYGMDLKKTREDRKSDVVAKILDIRYRETS